MMTVHDPVMGDLARHLASQDRDDHQAWAIEIKADEMLDDEQTRAMMAEEFIESLYLGDEKAKAEFHAFIGKQLLRARFDSDPMIVALYPNLAKTIREWIDCEAEAKLKKEATE